LKGALYTIPGLSEASRALSDDRPGVFYRTRACGAPRPPPMSITIKSADEQQKMREAGAAAASVLTMIEPHVKAGVSTDASATTTSCASSATSRRR
jgi:hypothetical protein